MNRREIEFHQAARSRGKILLAINPEFWERLSNHELYLSSLFWIYEARSRSGFFIGFYTKSLCFSQANQITYAKETLRRCAKSFKAKEALLFLTSLLSHCFTELSL